MNLRALCPPFLTEQDLIHCDWTEEEKEHWRKAIGIPIAFAPVVNGYFR